MVEIPEFPFEEDKIEVGRPLVLIKEFSPDLLKDFAPETFRFRDRIQIVAGTQRTLTTLGTDQTTLYTVGEGRVGLIFSAALSIQNNDAQRVRGRIIFTIANAGNAGSALGGSSPTILFLSSDIIFEGHDTITFPEPIVLFEGDSVILSTNRAAATGTTESGGSVVGIEIPRSLYDKN